MKPTLTHPTTGCFQRHQSRREQLPPLEVRVQFDRGCTERPPAFYERLNLRDWLNALDWMYAESSDRLDEFQRRGSSSEEIERELDIQRMLRDEIYAADRRYCQLALGNQ